MKIKSLTLYGFKSFPDRTKIDLHEGMTAIVGPNGCGKSNISDALRWVLGEQRPTAIRGLRMEEAIFGGTEQRRPIHRAEVGLELSNEDGTLPVPYSEVLIGRTVYRGGESEYSLNGSPCRLRDILDLVRDTGLGANMYAIIEGRMIDAILSDRAEERRALFEEAAEVGRYKDRRRTALRRLEQAEADLQRLDDVLGEVQGKVRSLAQQRGRAKRHAELRERRLRLEVALADHELARAREEIAEAEARLVELQAARPGEEAALQTAETEAETLRLRLAERERERSAAARRLDEVRRRLEERERERLVAAERIAAAERRLAALGEELGGLAARREELAAEIETARQAAAAGEAAVRDLAERGRVAGEEVETLAAARREAAGGEEEAKRRLAEVWRRLGLLEAEQRAASERLTDRRDELARRRAELEELRGAEAELREGLAALEARAAEAAEEERGLEDRLETAGSDMEARRAAVRSLRERAGALEGELSAERSRKAGLGSLVAAGADLPEAVAELLREERVDGVEGVLADAIEAPPELARAVESHLGPYLHGVLVKDWSAVDRVEAWLAGRGEEAGLLLLPVDPGPRVPAQEEGAAGPAPGVAVAELVTARGPGAEWARALLAGVRYEEERDLAPGGAPWVRADGTGQDPWGAVRLGRPGSGSGLLTRRAELEELERRVRGQERELERTHSRLKEAERALGEAEEAVSGLEGRLRQAARMREELEGGRAGTSERLERLAREGAQAGRRIEELEGSLHSARQREESESERQERLLAEREAESEAVARAESRLAEAEQAWERRRAALHDLELEMARRETELAGASQRLARAEAALREADERRSRLAAEGRELEAAAASSRERVERGEEDVVELIEARRELEERLREAEERLEAERAELEAREAALREARRTEREHAERRHRLELRAAELRARRAAIEERLEAEWDAPLERLRERVEPPEGGDAAEWEEELEEVRHRLNRLGPVNLLAEEEYESEKERLDFLLAQREDLVGARDDLRDSIRRINRKAAEAFLETFQEVRRNFQRTFETLFEGGECDLWLEDPEDPLDSPIEISASPRGKRTQRIHLLSGGERALTALALLFAIYLAKPSPFCLMDEVDAPLDETNVLRFVSMLERFKSDTQFILITHNPRTIEAADWIYGVTMQEPGVSSVVGIRFAEAADQVA